MSDGSDTLTFLDPKTLAVLKTLRVQDAGRPVGNLNELEWIEGEIWANVWMTDRIARISPNTGEVNAWVDLSTLFPAAAAHAARRRAQRDRVRQGHPPDLHHRQEVASLVSDHCVLTQRSSNDRAAHRRRDRSDRSARRRDLRRSRSR